MHLQGLFICRILASDLKHKTMTTLEQTYKKSDNFNEFMTSTGLSEDDAKKYWSKFSKRILVEQETVFEVAAKAMRFVDALHKAGARMNIYTGETNGDLKGWDFYSSISGHLDGQYFDTYFIARGDIREIEISETTKASRTALKEMIGL